MKMDDATKQVARAIAGLVWVSHGETESGDALDLIVWTKQPTKGQVDAVYREKYPQEYDEVGRVCFEISEASIRT
jgi:hypothetical protein